jgi:hypothetical protein
MPTLLMGHGQVMTDQRILVPPGFTMSFLIDESRVMPFANGVGVVMNIETLTQEGFQLSSYHEAGEEISNHALHVLTSNQRSWYAQVDPEDGSCFYAGEDPVTDGVRLCEDPGPGGACAQSGDGTHSCGGLLSMAWGDPNLVWVSCRQNPDPSLGWSANKPQNTFGSEANDPGNVQRSEFVDFAEDAWKRLRTDPDGFAAYFDGLADEEVAQLMYKLQIRKWTFQRHARAWLAQGTTDEQFYAFVQGHDDVDQKLYLDDPMGYTQPAADLRAAWERGQFVRHARDYREAQGDENFLLYVNGLDQAARTMLEAYPDLAAAMRVPGDATGAQAQSARFGMTVDEIDWGLVQSVNEKAVKETPDGGQVAFWQLPTGEVLIGGAEQPETYRKLIELVRDGTANPSGNQPNGSITVTKGGLRTGAGKLEVTGATDRATMQAWLEAFSDKRITFA